MLCSFTGSGTVSYHDQDMARNQVPGNMASSFTLQTCSASAVDVKPLSSCTGLGTIQGHDPDLAQHQVPGDMASSIILATMAATAAGQGSPSGPLMTHASGYHSQPLSLKQLVEAVCDYFR